MFLQHFLLITWVWRLKRNSSPTYTLCQKMLLQLNATINLIFMNFMIPTKKKDDFIEINNHTLEKFFLHLFLLQTFCHIIVVSWLYASILYKNTIMFSIQTIVFIHLLLILRLLQIFRVDFGELYKVLFASPLIYEHPFHHGSIIILTIIRCISLGLWFLTCQNTLQSVDYIQHPFNFKSIIKLTLLLVVWLVHMVIHQCFENMSSLKTSINFHRFIRYYKYSP